MNIHISNHHRYFYHAVFLFLIWIPLDPCLTQIVKTLNLPQSAFERHLNHPLIGPLISTISLGGGGIRFRLGLG